MTNSSHVKCCTDAVVYTAPQRASTAKKQTGSQRPLEKVLAMDRQYIQKRRYLHTVEYYSALKVTSSHTQESG